MKGSLLQDYLRSDEFRRARSLLEAGFARLGDFWGGSLALFLGAWHKAREDEAGNCILVTSCQEDADELLEELEAFVETGVASFPAWDSLFLPDSNPDPLVYGERLRVLERLLGREEQGCFIVTPVHALIQPVPQAAVLREGRLELRPGLELPPARLAEMLTAKGYRNVRLAEDVGEFSSRGDIFDVF